VSTPGTAGAVLAPVAYREGLDVLEVRAPVAAAAQGTAERLERLHRACDQTGVDRVLIDTSELRETPDVRSIYRLGSRMRRGLGFASVVPERRPAARATCAFSTTSRATATCAREPSSPGTPRCAGSTGTARPARPAPAAPGGRIPRDQ